MSSFSGKNTLTNFQQIPIPSTELPQQAQDLQQQTGSNLQQSLSSGLNLPNINVNDISGQIATSLQDMNNVNPDQLQQTAYNFYKPEIERQFQDAQSMYDTSYGMRGFGNSSSKALADVELQRLRSEELGRAQERAFLNAQQLAPQLMNAYGQNLNNLAGLAYMPAQMQLQQQQGLGNLYGSFAGQGLNQQQLALQGMAQNQAASLEGARLQDQFALNTNELQARIDQANAANQLNQQSLGQNMNQFEMAQALDRERLAQQQGQYGSTLQQQLQLANMQAAIEQQRNANYNNYLMAQAMAGTPSSESGSTVNVNTSTGGTISSSGNNGYINPWISNVDNSGVGWGIDPFASGTGIDPFNLIPVQTGG